MVNFIGHEDDCACAYCAYAQAPVKAEKLPIALLLDLNVSRWLLERWGSRGAAHWIEKEVQKVFDEVYEDKIRREQKLRKLKRAPRNFPRRIGGL